MEQGQDLCVCVCEYAQCGCNECVTKGALQKMSHGDVILRCNLTFLTHLVLWYNGKEGPVLYIGNKIFFVLAFTRLMLYGRYILFWLRVQL